MANILKIAVIQADLHWEDAVKNRELFSKHIDDIKEEVDLIILPEMFSTGIFYECRKSR